MVSPVPLSSESAKAPERGLFVHIIIVLACVLFLATVALLYYRSITVQEPKTILVINGSDQLNDAIAQVDGPSLVNPLQVKMNVSTSYGARFYLAPGGYTLSILAGAKEPIYQHEIILSEGRTWTIDLSKWGKQTPQQRVD